MECQRCERPSNHETCEHCLRILAGSALLVATKAVEVDKPKVSRNRGGFKHDSESLAVVPEHVEHVREIYRTSGLGDIEHLPDGRPIFTSANQFQQACKVRGFKTGRDGFDQLQTGRDIQIARQKFEAARAESY